MKYLIAGLGNIGNEYENTRHNIGFLIVDALAQECRATFQSERLASVARCKYRGRSLILIKPSTYMNLSGKAIQYWINKEKTDLTNLLVVTDDLALPLGTLRLKKKGSDGGHNGLADIIYQLETTEFPRLRFGIGNDFAKGYQVDFVLSKWTSIEEKNLLPRIRLAVETIQSFVFHGIDKAMNTYNNK